MSHEFVGLRNPLHGQFWVRPMAEIDADLATIRSRDLMFIGEPKPDPGVPLPQGPGGWFVTRYEQILEVSKHAEVYSSAAGVTAIDSPPEFNEFFGSMIAMDNPRHARLRRLVAPGFTPRMMKKLEDSVDVQADLIIDEIAERGECDLLPM